MVENNNNHNHKKYHLKYKICISGASETTHCSKDALKQAEAMGKSIAERGLVLITGATTGIPYWAAKGAKEAGGLVIGLSPASSKIQHVKTYKLPLDYHDLIIYTGFEYSGRNLLLVRSSDAMIIMCGRIGTINEFTIGFEDKKPMGVFEGTGGTIGLTKTILEQAHRGMGKVFFSADPDELLDKILAAVEKNDMEE